VTEKGYIRYLTDEDRVRCNIELEKGKVTRFVVQYEILMTGNWRSVTRFDTFHGVVHRDLMAPDGKVVKKWFLHMGFSEGLTFAYNDLSENWQRYRDWFMSGAGAT
jgi:hypothetical protein